MIRKWIYLFWHLKQTLSKSDTMESTTTATTFKPQNNLFKIVITEPQVKFNDKLNVFDNYCVLSSHHAFTPFLKSKAQVFSWGHEAFGFCVSDAMLTSKRSLAIPTLPRRPPFSKSKMAETCDASFRSGTYLTLRCVHHVTISVTTDISWTGLWHVDNLSRMFVYRVSNAPCPTHSKNK